MDIFNILEVYLVEISISNSCFNVMDNRELEEVNGGGPLWVAVVAVAAATLVLVEVYNAFVEVGESVGKYVYYQTH